MFGKKEETATAPEVVAAITGLKQLSRDIEGDTRNVLEVCQRARKIDGQIMATSQQLAHARDTADMVKLADQLKALVENRSKVDEKIDSLADAGGQLARKINHIADTTLVRLGAALSKLAAFQSLKGE